MTREQFAKKMANFQGSRIEGILEILEQEVGNYKITPAKAETFLVVFPKTNFWLEFEFTFYGKEVLTFLRVRGVDFNVYGEPAEIWKFFTGEEKEFNPNPPTVSGCSIPVTFPAFHDLP